MSPWMEAAGRDTDSRLFASTHPVMASTALRNCPALYGISVLAQRRTVSPHGVTTDAGGRTTEGTQRLRDSGAAGTFHLLWARRLEPRYAD